MKSPSLSGRRIEILNGVGRRRRWAAETKIAIVAEALEAGVVLTDVAHWHVWNPSQLALRSERAPPDLAPCLTPVPDSPALVIAPERAPASREPAVIEISVGPATIRICGAVDGKSLATVHREPGPAAEARRQELALRRQRCRRRPRGAVLFADRHRRAERPRSRGLARRRHRQDRPASGQLARRAAAAAGVECRFQPGTSTASSYRLAADTSPGGHPGAPLASPPTERRPCPSVQRLSSSGAGTARARSERPLC
jgi:transposase-like protein